LRGFWKFWHVDWRVGFWKWGIEEILVETIYDFWM
jgi:hypothetical protein